MTSSVGPDVDLWDSDDVCQWLRELGLGEHTPSFVEDAIGGKELLELQKADFEVREGRGGEGEGEGEGEGRIKVGE